MNFPRLRLGIGFAVILGIATATAGLAQYSPITPGTPAPNITAPPTDTPSPGASGRPKRGRRAPNPDASGTPNPNASDTPEPPQFDTLDGVWEVEVQPLGKRLAKYTHLGITSTGADVSGYWEHDPHKTRSPLKGTFDGRLIALTVTLPDGGTATFSGYVESFGDMVGLFRASETDPGTAFTAEHRKKLKG